MSTKKQMVYRERVLKAIAAFATAIACLAAHQQLLVSAHAVLQNETEEQKRNKRKFEHEQQPLMKYLFKFRGKPQVPLRLFDRFGALMEDPNRQYCKKLTHLFDFEIVDLAALCENDIKAARETQYRKLPKNRGMSGRGRPPKLKPINRLLTVLEWLSSGDGVFNQEIDHQWAKSSVEEDRKHVLRAINKNLEGQIKWPTPLERAVLKEGYTGILQGVVGVFDCTEWIIFKGKDPEFEQKTYSGKAQANTMKTLAAMDKHGLYTYTSALAEGKMNDRDQWTSCDLYMRAGEYFSPGEKLASDGGFRGDGPQLISYDVLNTEEKIEYNLAFKEVRVGIENAFGRVQMWFPIFGAQQRYWKYDIELLELAIEASMKLHNWIIRQRGLSYNAENNPNNFYRHAW